MCSRIALRSRAGHPDAPFLVSVYQPKSVYDHFVNLVWPDRFCSLSNEIYSDLCPNTAVSCYESQPCAEALKDSRISLHAEFGTTRLTNRILCLKRSKSRPGAHKTHSIAVTAFSNISRSPYAKTKHPGFITIGGPR